MLALGVLLSLLAAPAPPAPSPGVVVLIGVDNDAPAGTLSATSVGEVRRRADSIVLLRSHDGALRAVWVPRDAVLRRPGGGRVGASQALRDGGVQRLDGALAATFGVRPQSHALLDFQGFGELIDAVGGVHWPGGPNPAGLPRKPRQLNGREALHYVLAPKGDIRADLRRIHRQMLLSQAFAATLPERGVGGIVRAAAILPHVGRTDLTPVEAAQLTLSLAAEPLECAVAPGRPDGGRYLPSPGARAAVRRMLGLGSGGENERGRRALPRFGAKFEVAAERLGQRLGDRET